MITRKELPESRLKEAFRFLDSFGKGVSIQHAVIAGEDARLTIGCKRNRLRFCRQFKIEMFAASDNIKDRNTFLDEVNVEAVVR